MRCILEDLENQDPIIIFDECQLFPVTPGVDVIPGVWKFPSDRPSHDPASLNRFFREEEQKLCQQIADDAKIPARGMWMLKFIL